MSLDRSTKITLLVLVILYYTNMWWNNQQYENCDWGTQYIDAEWEHAYYRSDAVWRYDACLRNNQILDHNQTVAEIWLIVAVIGFIYQLYEARREARS